MAEKVQPMHISRAGSLEAARLEFAVKVFPFKVEVVPLNGNKFRLGERERVYTIKTITAPMIGNVFYIYGGRENGFSTRQG